ncbi:MAG TPA: hypothetical protein VJ921_10015 [Vicinamibacteria bacterium]|nr:hypothetical protein [Vicinamibacteria bacterium]
MVIGVAGADYYARSAGLLFTTQDWDLFLPPDALNLLRAWRTCENAGLDLWVGDEPLERPVDRQLAEQVVSRRALVRCQNRELQVDLALVMEGFEFEQVWRQRRVFRVGRVGIPVARLAHIVASKAAAGRPKDVLFLAAHEEILRTLLRQAPSSGGRRTRKLRG